MHSPRSATLRVRTGRPASPEPHTRPASPDAVLVRATTPDRANSRVRARVGRQVASGVFRPVSVCTPGTQGWRVCCSCTGGTTNWRRWAPDHHHGRTVYQGFRCVATQTVTTTLCTVAADRAAHAARHDPPCVRLVGARRSRCPDGARQEIPRHRAPGCWRVIGGPRDRMDQAGLSPRPSKPPRRTALAADTPHDTGPCATRG
jgi:hypothetical protein